MSYRFALIGCGSIAPRHASQVALHGQLVAACDTEGKRVSNLAETYGASAYKDIDALLKKEKPEVVVICTPNGLHAAHTIQALRAGAHVLCEKPLSTTSGDARQMIFAARETGKRLFVVKQNRYNPPVQFVNQLLHQKKLGTIHAFQVNCFWNRPSSYYNDNWHGTISLDGGTLFTQFSHFIDLLYWWIGPISDVSGYRSNIMHRGLIEFEDNGVASLVMKSGAIGSLHYSINAHQKNFEGSITLFGEKGTVKIGGAYLNRLEYFDVENEKAPIFSQDSSVNTYGAYQGSMSNHPKVYEEMMKALADPMHPVPEGEEGLKCVEMIEQIYTGSPIIEINSR